jgi:putative Mg2+ transporter-C (MgtC) family protein
LFWGTETMNWGAISGSEVLIRLVVAMVLGGAIGLERERRERAAGLKTHSIVALASCLIMIVSAYGFPIPRDGTAGSLDPSRIAAQVVSGIGFLGAGVIIFRENTVRGLTTAATVWAVAGVGLAVGGGLYLAAIFTTALVLLIQFALRPLERRFFVRRAHEHRMMVTMSAGTDALLTIERLMRSLHIRIRSIQLTTGEDPSVEELELSLEAERQTEVLAAVRKIREMSGVEGVAYRRGALVQRRVHRREGPAAEVDEVEEDEEENGDGIEEHEE